MAPAASIISRLYPLQQYYRTNRTCDTLHVRVFDVKSHIVISDLRETPSATNCTFPPFSFPLIRIRNWSQVGSRIYILLYI